MVGVGTQVSRGRAGREFLTREPAQQADHTGSMHAMQARIAWKHAARVLARAERHATHLQAGERPTQHRRETLSTPQRKTTAGKH